MGDDIIKIKLGPVTLNGDALLRWVGKKTNPDPVEVVAGRFLKLFQDHGIAMPQIPRLIPEITYDKLGSGQRLLSSLTPDVLDSAANLFGVRLSWLEGLDDRIYELFCLSRKWTFRPPELMECQRSLKG